MTQRKHIDSEIECAGCGRKFGIIQNSHIVRCDGLSKLGVTNRAEYRERFGQTMSSEALQTSVSNIVKFNDGLTDQEKAKHAKAGHIVAVTKHPDLYRKAGLKGSAGLWNKSGQKERHARRLVDLNSKGFMAQKPNKLEQKFWDMIGADRINFASFKFWKTILTDRGYAHITPDFRVIGSLAVIEVYGNYWHQNDDPMVRIGQWKSVGCDCLVIWEHEINKQPELVKSKVEAFIGRNLHECVAPTINQVG